MKLTMMKGSMKRHFFVLLAVFSITAFGQPTPYVWTTPSRDAAGSMPCGGGDVGMNVWVEPTGDVLFYLARSGCFDENNSLLKLGRFRIRFSEPLRMEHFRQALVLHEGYVSIGDGEKELLLWADVEKPVVHVELDARHAIGMEVTYENWRTTDRRLTKREAFQSSYKFAVPATGVVQHRDSVCAEPACLTFLHHNADTTVFDTTVAQQQLLSVKDQLYNPLARRTFGGRMQGRGFVYAGTVQDSCQDVPCQGYRYLSLKASRRHHLQIVMATVQGTIVEWQKLLQDTERSVTLKLDRKTARNWWRSFWQRSYVEPLGDGPHRELLRNYTLFRYMLGCNARGAWPTKFNGGLFTFDPSLVKDEADYRLSPDFRNWGGGTHTAQNQRLVYWPMLKNGDYDALTAQLDFYLRCLKNTELRSRVYWNHGGACFTEQIENFGLPNLAEYGKKRPEGFDPGMERNAWLEYEWDTALEFCQMALLAHEYCGMDIRRYEPLIASVLDFFDEHYQYLARQRSAKVLDDRGRLVIYPGSGAETFKMAYNPASTIAGLRTVTAQYIRYRGDSSRFDALQKRLPDIPIREGRIQPAEAWARVQNTESPQLYPVFPWRVYGVGRSGLDVAVNTYRQDTLALKFRSHIGWKQDNIWAACLGLTDEAQRLTELKMGDGPYRFPAFWGPGFDWSPDHNWGGSGMIGIQEMLLQEAPDGQLLLFPAWPREWDVRFRLHATDGRIVEAEMKGGRISTNQK